MKKMVIIFLLLTSLAMSEEPLNVNLQYTSLPHAIRLMSKMLGMNVILSPSIHGEAVLNLKNVTPQDAFNTLLMTHGLAKIKMGKLWMIAPQKELIKLKEEEVKWRKLNEETASLASEFFQIRYAKAEDISRLIQGEKTLLSKRGQVRVDQRTNIIYIEDTAQRITNLHKLITRLDIPAQQIAIVARLISVDSDCERELGISFTNAKTGNGFTLLTAKLANATSLDIKLAALEKSGHVELISSPSLFTDNQQLASIEAGEEVPYQEVSESGGTAVVFKKAVLALKVIPQILPDKNILLRLRINQDRPNSKLIQGMPTINTRQMITSVKVKSGQTIVLGGIYETNDEEINAGLPFLCRIPLVGWLFKQQNIRRNKRQLLIFVTPKIID